MSLSSLESDMVLPSLALDSYSSSRSVLYRDFFSTIDSPIEDSDSCTLVILRPCSYFRILLIFLQSCSRFLSQYLPKIRSMPFSTTRGRSTWNLQYSVSMVIFPPNYSLAYSLLRNSSCSSVTWCSRNWQAAQASQELQGYYSFMMTSIQPIRLSLWLEACLAVSASFIMMARPSPFSSPQNMQSFSAISYLYAIINYQQNQQTS